MKKLLTVKIIAYGIDDLSPAARQKIINQTATFWADISHETEADTKRIQRAVDEANRLQTPWFLADLVAEKYEQEILTELRDSDSLFDEDGNHLPITEFVNQDNTAHRMLFDMKHEVQIENYNPQSEGDVL